MSSKESSVPQDEGKVPLVSEAPPAYQSSPGVVYVQQPTVMTQYPTPAVGVSPPDYLILSVFSTFCCFMPLGIVALIKSLEVRSAFQNGRLEDAQRASRSALTFNKLSIVIGLVILVLALVFVGLMQLTWIIPIALSD